MITFLFIYNERYFWPLNKYRGFFNFIIIFDIEFKDDSYIFI